MSFRFFLLYVLIGIALSFGFAPHAFAVTASDISISVSPENPQPYDTVTVSLSSFAGDLNSTKITWTTGGKTVLTGTGEKSYTFKAGAADTTTTINIRLAFSDGTVDTRVSIKPSTLVLLWQATDSYVPPFYKGRALPSADSKVKVVALPEVRNGSSLVNPKNMTYSWQIDYSNDLAGSGYGKNAFYFNNDFLAGGNVINVTANTTDGKSAVSGGVTVGTVNPKIVLYKRDPKLGTLWNKALADSYKITEDEIFEAAPYYISPKNPINPILQWNWTINNSPLSVNGLMKNLIPLSAQEGVSGAATLGVTIQNRYKVFENAEKKINIQF